MDARRPQVPGFVAGRIIDNLEPQWPSNSSVKSPRASEVIADVMRRLSSSANAPACALTGFGSPNCWPWSSDRERDAAVRDDSPQAVDCEKRGMWCHCELERRIPRVVLVNTSAAKASKPLDVHEIFPVTLTATLSGRRASNASRRPAEAGCWAARDAAPIVTTRASRILQTVHAARRRSRCVTQSRDPLAAIATAEP